MNTQTLLERIGGQAAIAKECAVTDSAVSQWAKEDRLPRARAQYLRLAHPGDHWDEYDAHQRREPGGMPAATAQGA